MCVVGGEPEGKTLKTLTRCFEQGVKRVLCWGDASFAPIRQSCRMCKSGCRGSMEVPLS